MEAKTYKTPIYQRKATSRYNQRRREEDPELFKLYNRLRMREYRQRKKDNNI